MIYTYIIRSAKDGKLYTGATNDLQKRFKEHSNGEVSSTKSRGPFQLVYYEACISREDAFIREKFLKTGMGKRYIKNRLKRFLALTGQAGNGASPVRGNLPKASLSSNGGYIAVTSVLIISLLLITITVALSMVNYFSRYNILENEFKDTSSNLAEACADYAMGQLAVNSSYTPSASDHSYTVGSDTCNVVSVNPSGGQTTIITQGIYPKAQTEKSYTNLHVVVNSATLAVISWQETPN